MCFGIPSGKDVYLTQRNLIVQAADAKSMRQRISRAIEF